MDLPYLVSPIPHRFWCVISFSIPVSRFGVWIPISFSRGVPTSIHKLNMSLTKPFQTNGAFDAHLGPISFSGCSYLASPTKSDMGL